MKGAWSSASDSVTPVPEDANVTNHVFHAPYFGITYALPQDWIEDYKGPPPSDTGRYVLAQLATTESFKGSAPGSILITAQDLFFAAGGASSAAELVKSAWDNLQVDYKVETPPTKTAIAGRPFTYFAYRSPAAEMHWYVLATDARCHVVEMVLSSRDSTLLKSLMQDLGKKKLFAASNSPEGDGANADPVCVKDYARDENLLARVDPIFTEHRFNPVPVRIIINKEGRIRHIHFLSAFPDQAKAISDALGQWEFKPYRVNGEPAEVETGILFGLAKPFPPSRAPKPGFVY